MAENEEVVIVGGGVIGLSIAYALAREGVTEHGARSPRAGPRGFVGRRGADPTAVARPVPLRFLRRCCCGPGVPRCFPQWSAALREETGIDNGFRRSGGVDVACTEAEEDALRAAAGQWRTEGIVHERLRPARLSPGRAGLEPGNPPGLLPARPGPDSQSLAPSGPFRRRRRVEG